MTGQQMNLTMTAVARDVAHEDATEVRKAGFVPANLYGRQIENQSLKIKATDFTKVFQQAGESALIDLYVADKQVGKILIKDVQLHPVKDTIMHADLYQIREDEKLHTEIPLLFIGEAPAVKEMGGILVKQTEKVEVKCLPKDLVHEIEVDVTQLATFEDSILVSALTIPKGIEVLTDPTVMVAAVSEPRKVEEVVPEVTEEAGTAEGAEEKAEGEGEAKPAEEGAGEEVSKE